MNKARDLLPNLFENGGETPPTTWSVPEVFPDLSAARGIAVDVETRDDELKERGPGVRRGARIVGVAIATDDGAFRAYYPVGHDEGPNLDRAHVIAWLRRELSRPWQAKIGTNILYDLDFLAEAGAPAAGDRWIDVQVAEALIDENARGRYSLASLADKYAGRPKATDLLARACLARGLAGDPRRHVWRLPASVVGPYAIEDVLLPIDVYRKQKKVMEIEGTFPLFRVETFLLPLLLRMRRAGVRVDTAALDRTAAVVEGRLVGARERLDAIAGFRVEPWAAASVARAFDAAGAPYERLRSGAPSFTKEFLRSSGSEVGRLVLECRRLQKFSSAFLEGAIRGSLLGDRIHALFHSMKGDENGTVIGRFSSSCPNLQQIPSRDRELAPLCRSLFVPEEGCLWGRADYSQIEFRFFAHFAVGDGAEEIREEYRTNPEADFHKWVAALAFGDPDRDRARAKNINFGLLYGMGRSRLAEYVDASPEDVGRFLDAYRDRFPCAVETARAAQDVAESRGYVRSILRRRRRFHDWEPADRRLAEAVGVGKDRDEVARRAREAARELGVRDARPGAKRAGVHKALHFVVAGSAADLAKKAMVDCWRSGVFDVLVPHLTVHDELDVSVPDTAEGREAFEEMRRLMESAIEISVPVRVDARTGRNWEDAK